uniref:Spartin a n=1 Tax=Neogobius melanostomus TaxID=47308 RepID=A0A8C6SH15_9GOBI
QQTPSHHSAEVLLIRDQYESAFHSLDQGLTAEEAGHKSDALLYYRKALQHLTQGLQIPTTGERFQGPSWDAARELQQKMRDTLQTRTRLLMNLTQNFYPNLEPNSQPLNSSILHMYPSVPPDTAMANPADQPPAYTPQPTHHSLYFDPTTKLVAVATHEKELIHFPAGVQMFFVAPSGQVSSVLAPGFLRIFTVDLKEKDSERPSAFLHVSITLGWSDSGIYMFPDTLATVPGAFVGLVLSSELPAEDREMFQDVLAQLVEFRIQVGVASEVINLSQKVPLLPPRPGATEDKEKTPLPVWSEKMAQHILHGATWLSEGFIKGADATSRAIHKSGFKIRDRMTPEETPSEVSPQVAKGLEATKSVTGDAVRFSKFLVNGVSAVAGHVAEKVAPHVKKHGSKLVPESLKKNKDGNLDGAKHVAASSVLGFSTLWSSLEGGAKLIGKSVTTETVTTVKYGEDAGEATDTALKSVVNVGVTAYHIDNLGIKAILKTTGKEAAKAVYKGKNGKEAERTKTQSLQTDTQAKDTEAKDIGDIEKKPEEKK